MMKILEYILERGGKVKVDAIPAPPANPSSIQNCFEKVFEHEIDNTNAVYKLVKMSFNEEDWATWNFMQWFVKEQTEEETLALSLLDKIKIAGGEKQAVMHCIILTGTWKLHRMMPNLRRQKPRTILKLYFFYEKLIQLYA